MKHLSTFFSLVFILSLFLFISNPTHGQDDDISKYMDDGDIAARKNYISTDFGTNLFGNWGLQYGHFFGKNFGLEVGVGILTSSYNGSVFKPIDEGPDPKATSGFSFLFRPSYYVFSKDLESPSVSLIFRMNSFGKDKRYILQMGVEKDWILWNRLLLGIGFDFGACYRPTFKAEDEPNAGYYIIDMSEPESKFSPAFNIVAKIGFVL